MKILAGVKLQTNKQIDHGFDSRCNAWTDTTYTNTLFYYY